MKCQICQERKRNHICSSCINNTLSTKKSLAKEYGDDTCRMIESYKSHAGMNDYVTGSGRMILSRLRYQVERLEAAVEDLGQTVVSERQRLVLLEKEKSQRLEVLAGLENSHGQRDNMISLKSDIESSIANYETKSNSVLIQRRKAVQTLVSLFRLRKVQKTIIRGSRQNTQTLDRSESTDDFEDRFIEDTFLDIPGLSQPPTDPTPPEAIKTVEFHYRIYHVTCPSQYKFPIHSSAIRNRLNAGLEYATHFLLLLTKYLNITLPFALSMKTSGPCIHEGPQVIGRYLFSLRVPVMLSQWRLPLSSFQPLVLMEADPSDEEAHSDFVTALAKLNYNILFLGFSQNVQPPIAAEASLLTFQNLASCCEAEGVGRGFDLTDVRIDSSSARTPRMFHADFEHVLRVHLRWASSGKSGTDVVAELLLSKAERQDLSDDDEWMMIEDSH